MADQNNTANTNEAQNIELIKIRNDFEIRQRELALEEKRLKLEEKKTGFISIVAAIVGALGTVLVGYSNGWFEVEKTNVTNNANYSLEKLKFSNELIKNVLSTNNPANSLKFYADIGLLEGLNSTNVRSYADQENKRIQKGDEGVSLLPNFVKTSGISTNTKLWLTKDLILKLYPNANDSLINALTIIGNYTLTGFEINKNANRLANFLAQASFESAGFKMVDENGNYSADRLLKIFPTYFDSETVKAYAHQPEKIFNLIYANKMGNGTEASGDGYRYRGRGYFKLAGKREYEKYSKITGIDLVTNPDIINSDPNVTLLIAAIYWNNLKLNELADQGKTKEITKLINIGEQGLDERLKLVETALNLFNQ
jgi:putative chitinase